jgi:hypothetical protein
VGGLLLLVVLLVDLRLRHGHRVVRAGRHHGTCGRRMLGDAVAVLKGRCSLRLAIRSRSETGVGSGLRAAECESSTWLTDAGEGPGAREKRSVSGPSMEAPGVGEMGIGRSLSQIIFDVPMPPRRCGTCCPPALGGAGCGAYPRYCGCILSGPVRSGLSCDSRSDKTSEERSINFCAMTVGFGGSGFASQARRSRRGS